MTDHYDNAQTGTNEKTFVMLSQILGTQITNAFSDPLNPVFVCKEAPTDGPTVWCPAVVRHVYLHPRAFPGYDDLFSDNGVQNKNHPFRKLAQIRNASDKSPSGRAPPCPVGTSRPSPSRSPSTPGVTAAPAGVTSSTTRFPATPPGKT